MLLENKNDRDQRKVLYQTEAFEVVSIDWTDARTSEMHHHGWSQCFVLIESGLFENTLDLGGKKEVQRFEVGQVVRTPVNAHHEMRCLSPTGKTLHVYTPKLQTLEIDKNFKAKSDVDELQENLRLLEPTRIESLLQIMQQIRNHSITTHSPYFMNQLFSGVLPQMLMAEELIAQTKTTLATFEASPAFSLIESEVIESLGQIIGWAPTARDGVSVPGGSAANFMALHCARQRMFPEIKKTGMGGKNLKVFVSSEAHYSFKKACAALGFGTDNLVLVPVDEKGRMIPAQLEEMIQKEKNQGAVPLLVSATAGTTVLGAFDPIDELALICKKHQVWLHVDGAWGGPALFSNRIRHLVRGIESADSMTFDAHKLFGAGLTCSFLLTKHAGLLLEANDVSGGEYLFHQDDATIDRGKASWQCGRKADATSFWTIWKSLGTEGLGKFVDRLLEVRDQTLSWIPHEPRLELIANPDFLNICVRIAPPAGRNKADWSRHVREVLKEKNLAMVNYSTNEDGHFLRLILAHPSLGFKEVQEILQWALQVE